MPSIVKALRLLADETRLRLLLLLQQEELSVVELQEILGMGQSRISDSSRPIAAGAAWSAIGARGRIFTTRSRRSLRLASSVRRL